VARAQDRRTLISCFAAAGPSPAPKRVFLLPFIARNRPLVRAVCIHHEKLRIGLWAPVIERSFIAKAQARAIEHDVLAIGRPGAVGVVSGGVCQLFEIGTIWADSEDFVGVCATCIPCEGDAVT